MIFTFIAQSLHIGPSGSSSIHIKGPLEGITSLNDLINVLTGFIYPFAGVALLFILTWGGFDYLTSRGDPEKVKTGQAKIGAGVIGFALLMLSYIISQVIGFIFGVGEGIL